MLLLILPEEAGKKEKDAKRKHGKNQIEGLEEQACHLTPGSTSSHSTFLYEPSISPKYATYGIMAGNLYKNLSNKSLSVLTQTKRSKYALFQSSLFNKTVTPLLGGTE